MRFLGFARTRLIELYQFCQENRLHSMVKWFALPNDFKLMVRVFGDDGWIRVSGGACPDLLSGLIDPVFPNGLIQVGDTQEFSRYYPKDGFSWISTPGLVTSGQQTINKHPGMYSGEMRPVIQDLIGRDQTLEHFSFTFSTTHGIFTAANGSKWVIKISSEGVKAYRLLTCSLAKTELLNTLDYIPLPTPEPENPIILADAITVQAAYNKSSFYDGQGWAFSSSGHLAGNCVYIQEANFLHSYCYVITIVETDNAPSSATMSQESTGIIHGPNTTHVKFPLSGAQLYSFDMNASAVAFDQVCDSPMHAIYVGESLRKLIFIYNPGSRNVINSCGSAFASGYYGSDLVPGFSGGIAGEYTEVNQPHFNFPGWTGTSSLRQTVTEIEESISYAPAGENIDFGGSDPETSSGLGVRPASFFSYSGVRRTGEGQTDYNSVAIIPSTDREAVYLGEKITFAYSNISTRTINDVLVWSGADQINAVAVGDCVFVEDEIIVNCSISSAPCTFGQCYHVNLSEGTFDGLYPTDTWRSPCGVPKLTYGEFDTGLVSQGAQSSSTKNGKLFTPTTSFELDISDNFFQFIQFDTQAIGVCHSASTPERIIYSPDVNLMAGSVISSNGTDPYPVNEITDLALVSWIGNP